MDQLTSGNQINGHFIAKLFEKYVSQTVIDFQAKIQEDFPTTILRDPLLLSFANPADEPSMKYSLLKAKKAEELAIHFNLILLGDDSIFEEAKQKVEEANLNPKVDGILIQLPTTPKLKSKENDLLSTILPEKDVDGLTGKGHIYLPATILGIEQILQTIPISIEDQVVAIIGSEGHVGKQLVAYLQTQNPKKIIQVDQKLLSTKLQTDLKIADIIFSCTGVKNLIKGSFLKRGVIAFDVGLGDLDQSVYEVASLYTPQVGGIGPNTIVALMRNVVKAYMKNIESLYYGTK